MEQKKENVQNFVEEIGNKSDHNLEINDWDGTTMTVREMGDLLGLKKTERYYLVKKQYFKTEVLYGQLRVDRESFEEWYANQVHYKKITGEQPGEKLRETLLSTVDIAQMLSLNEAVVHEVLKAAGVKKFMEKHHIYYDRADYERWYKSQSKYRNQEDRKKEEAYFKTLITAAGMGRCLGITRKKMELITRRKEYEGYFERVTFRERLYFTQESFENWYMNQNEYQMSTEVEPVIVAKEKDHKLAVFRRKRIREMGSMKGNGNLEYLSVAEAAFLAGVHQSAIVKNYQSGKLPCVQTGMMIRIAKKDFHKWMKAREKAKKEET